MIDPMKCMALKDGEPTGGPRCQAPATHWTIMGRRCAHHAERFRESLRNPNTLGNILAGGGRRTEKQIAKMVVELKGVTT